MIKDIVELEIIDQGASGDGIAKLDGIVYFVKNALIGEIVKATIIKENKKFKRAKVIKVIKSSPIRQTPFCPVFFQCGGCDLQHIEYDKQLEIKQNEVKNCIYKQTKVEYNVDKVVFDLKTFYYRNKLQLPVGLKDNKVVVGFYKEKSHNIIPINSCPLHGDWADILIRIFTSFANLYKISVYNEKQNKGLLRHIVARKIENKLSITLVINGNKLPYINDFIEMLKCNLDYDFSLHLSINKKKTNLIMGDKLVLVYGEENIKANILGVDVNVSPLSFMQVNDAIRDKIYKRVVEEIGDSKIVIDAYSGAGLMTALAAKNAQIGVGVEIVAPAVKNADNLMIDNDLDYKVVNICGDASVEISKICELIKNTDKFENDSNYKYQKLANLVKNSDMNNLSDDLAVILDPPRKGCDEKVLKEIVKLKPQKIVYVSCNPSTLARDLTKLTEYNINFITPYDMFPQTKHVETCVLLYREDYKSGKKNIKVEVKTEM